MDYKRLGRAKRAISRAITLIKDSGVCQGLIYITTNDLNQAKKLIDKEVGRYKKETGYKKPDNTLPALKRKFDRVFSEYIRRKGAVLIDKLWYNKCITCGCMWEISGLDAGHFIGRQFTAVRWNEDNCRPQCRSCNRFEEGNKDKFRAALVNELGEQKVLLLESMKKRRKYSRPELLLLFKEYTNKVKEMK